jgi:hypothetical protein
MNKKKDKDKLTHAQFEILRKQHNDALTTDKWIRSTGLNTETFNYINPKILQALQTAHSLLKQHSILLTTEQTKIIQNFIHKASSKKLSLKLKPESAYQVLNIGTKINRQLFKTYKQL